MDNIPRLFKKPLCLGSELSDLFGDFCRLIPILPILAPKTTLGSCNINYLRNWLVGVSLLNQLVSVARPRLGYHWGTLVWEFDDDMCSFKGKWSYCNNKPNSRWEGTFIKPLLRKTQENPVVDN